MHSQLIAVAALLIPGAQWFAAGQEVQVPLKGCDALPCANSTSKSVCKADDTQVDPAQTELVGIASNAVNLTSNTQLSLTLVEGSRSVFGNEPGFVVYERTLYVGAPESSDQPPAACALILQYQSQTFAVPGSSSRDGMFNGTTSCAGVLDQRCQDSFASFIKSYNQTSSTPDCTALAGHVTTQFRSEGTTLCNYFSNLISVTGAPLFNTTEESLAGDECRPTLPQTNRLYRVSSVQTILVGNSEQGVGGDVFGGRQGFTPIITTVYGGEGESVDSVQFACLQALRKSGKVLEDTTTSMATVQDPVGLTLTTLLALGVVAALL